MTLDSLPDLDTSGLCLVKTLSTVLTCWPYRNMALRDGARTSTRTSSVAKGRTASIHTSRACKARWRSRGSDEYQPSAGCGRRPWYDRDLRPRRCKGSLRAYAAPQETFRFEPASPVPGTPRRGSKRGPAAEIRRGWPAPAPFRPMEFHSLAPSPRRRRSTLMEGAPKPRSPERPQGPSGCPEVGRAARTPTDGCPPSPRATRASRHPRSAVRSLECGG